MPHHQNNIGSVLSLFRYPVKSMMGEALNSSTVTGHGLLGDRMYALVDSADGKVGSAKNLRKWPALFDCHAAFTEPPRISDTMPPVSITLPDGTAINSVQNDLNAILSKAFKRDVTLKAISMQHNASTVVAEEYRQDLKAPGYRDTVTDFILPEGTFFDDAVIHLLTTATLGRLGEYYPQGRFDARRFRPNIVVKAGSNENAFIENDWVGQTLAIGDEVRLHITGPCPRCIMTTLAQEDLPQDTGILRTAARYNKANVGVYARVLQGGTIRLQDMIRME